MRLREMDSFTFVLMGTGLVLALGITLYLVRSGGQSHPQRGEIWVTGGQAARGEEIIETRGCGGCHVIPGIRTAVGEVGPPLTRLREQQFIAGQLPNTPENLVKWVMDPDHIAPETAMPDLGVTEAEARDIAAYLYEVN